MGGALRAKETGADIVPGRSSTVARRRRLTMRAAAVRKGTKHTPETLAKMSAARRGKRPMLGKRLSEEAKAKIGAAHRGLRKPRKKPMSPEDRAKIAAALTGRTLSEEHRANLAAAHRGQTASAETRSRMSDSQGRRRAREA
jgi:hypothetical protein